MKYLKFISMLLLLLPIEAMAQFAWYGANGKAQVVTGLGNGTNTEGIWFSFTDKYDGGESQIHFPFSENDIPDDTHVNKYGGVYGEVFLDLANAHYIPSPYVGLGFPVVGETEDDPYSYEEGNAFKWGGLAIGYKSDLDITFQLGLSNQEEAAMGYAIPEYTLPASNKEKFVRIPWNSFKQPDWGGGLKISGSEAAKELVKLKFTIYGNTRDEPYHFLITKIGSYDMPEMPESPSGCISPAVAIDTNDDWYTISGVQLRNQPTVRGVYIHNGQKVVVK